MTTQPQRRMNDDYMMLMVVGVFCSSITAVAKMKILYYAIKSNSSFLIMFLLGFIFQSLSLSLLEFDVASKHILQNE